MSEENEKKSMIQLGNETVELKPNMIIIGNKPLHIYYTKALTLIEEKKFTEIQFIYIALHRLKVDMLLRNLKDSHGMYERDVKELKSPKGKQYVSYISL